MGACFVCPQPMPQCQPILAQLAISARARGLAIGLYSAGTPLGLTLAPIFVISVQHDGKLRVAVKKEEAGDDR